MAIRNIKYLAKKLSISKSYANKLAKAWLIVHLQRAKNCPIEIKDEDILKFIHANLNQSSFFAPLAEVLVADRQLARGGISPENHPLLTTKWLRVAEAAQFLDVSISCVYDRVKLGYITHLRVRDFDANGNEIKGAIRISEIHLRRLCLGQAG